MSPRPFVLAVLACSLQAGAAHAAPWSAVPGAHDVEVDLRSIQQAGTRVRAWLRWRGRPPHPLPQLAAPDGAALRIARTAVLTEFDCGGRSMRALAASAYDGRGAPLALSSTPGPVLPLPGADATWAYDAVCEAARSGGRL